jgi:hypothetical protein
MASSKVTPAVLPRAGAAFGFAALGFAVLAFAVLAFAVLTFPAFDFAAFLAATFFFAIDLRPTPAAQMMERYNDKTQSLRPNNVAVRTQYKLDERQSPKRPTDSTVSPH